MGIEISGNLKFEDFKISSESISFQVEGILYSFVLSEISSKLAKASDEERNNFRFSPSGYGIHWDLLDEDISLPALIHSK